MSVITIHAEDNLAAAVRLYADQLGKSMNFAVNFDFAFAGSVPATAFCTTHSLPPQNMLYYEPTSQP